MKTKIILAALLGLSASPLFAAADFNDSPATSGASSAGYVLNVLAPSTPVEATFEEPADMNMTMMEMSGIAPVAPRIAEFNDEAPAPVEVNVSNLVPVTPKEADFEDTSDSTVSVSEIELAPVTPAVADFTDQT